MIPIHADDYPLLGFKFDGKYYFDKCMVMGASSSCKTFERIASALEWILKNKFGVKYCIHILDDFLMFAYSAISGQHYLNSWRKMCKMLGWIIAEDKTEGPGTCMVFSGIEVDTVLMQARLPIDKVTKYAKLLKDTSEVRKVKLKQMQRVIGCLQFAVRVVIPGKPFIRRLIDTIIGVSVPFHYVTLNSEAQKDIAMWQTFLDYYNGKSFFIKDYVSSHQLHLGSDASGFACSAHFGREWFSINFPPSWKGFSIAFLELYPIVVAINVYGRRMCNSHVTFHCDNKSVTYIINKQTSKDKKIMVLVRNLVLTCMQYNIVFKAQFIRGVDNVLADRLSRLQVSEALLTHFNMVTNATRIPNHLMPENFKGIWTD